MRRLLGECAGKARRRGVSLFRRTAYRFWGALGDVVVVRTRQGVLAIPTRDEGIGAPLYCQRQFEYDYSLAAVRFLKERGFLTRDSVAGNGPGGVSMLDVGANIGVIGIGLLLAGEVDRVLALEPDPATFGLLRANAERNALTNRMLCLELAAGDAASTLSMELSPVSSGDHRIRTAPVPGAAELQGESARRTIQVRSLPLPQILDLPDVRRTNLSSPSLVWIDVQGYEGPVFRGAASLLENAIPTVAEI